MTVIRDGANLRACARRGGHFPVPGIEVTMPAAAMRGRPPLPARQCPFPAPARGFSLRDAHGMSLAVAMRARGRRAACRSAGPGRDGPHGRWLVVSSVSRRWYCSRSVSRCCSARTARARSAAASCSDGLQPGPVLLSQGLPLPDRVITGLPDLITSIGFSLAGAGQFGLGGTNQRSSVLTGLISFRPRRLGGPRSFRDPLSA